ncbi:IS110 family transposase, partial [Robertmurraya korlensis]|uniref:IS110 family transposase n=1 Tax=Robertmurraya korlensis TaxID=519977 RepID=UPI000A8143A7
NYNQNEKIAQITSQTLIISVDIAKFKHVARARGMEFGSPCYFDNTKLGFQLFLDWINQLKLEQHMEKVIVGMEPTGHYWLNLAHILKENHYFTDQYLLDHLRKAVSRSVGINKIIELKQAAKESIGLCQGSNMAKLELATLLDKYDLIQENRRTRSEDR